MTNYREKSNDMFEILIDDIACKDPTFKTKTLESIATRFQRKMETTS